MIRQDAQKDNSEVLRVSQSSPLRLRDYQSECVTAIQSHFASAVAQEGCLATLPTGSGKSLVIASLAHDAALRGDRVLCVTPTRELCRQNADKVLAMFPDAELGIFSAGLNRRDTDSSILVGTINSIYDRADELTVSGPIDLAVIDECHRIPHGMNQANGMYNRLLTDLRAVNPAMRICGTTATPYRLVDGTGVIDCKSVSRLPFQKAFDDRSDGKL